MPVFEVLRNKGFTLIESLIALLIVGITLAALIGSYSQNALSLLRAKERVVSHILMNNLIINNRQADNLPLGRTSDSLTFGQKTWYWRATVSKFQSDNVLQVQLEVFSSKADRDAKRPIQSQKLYVQQ